MILAAVMLVGAARAGWMVSSLPHRLGRTRLAPTAAIADRFSPSSASYRAR
jgi:hypothetical protein